MSLAWTDDLGVSDDPDKFKEAIAAFRRKVPMTDAEWDDLSEEEKVRAFKVANVAQADLVQDVFDALEDAIANGSTLEDFKAAVGDQLAEAWGGEDAPRMEAVFRTNVLGAYNQGRVETFTTPDAKESHPYWRFDAIEDDRIDDECAEMDGTVLPQDDPWWQSRVPPIHMNCVTPGTMIATISGQRPIEVVRPGDLVLSHDGAYHPVAHVLVSHHEGRLRMIRHGQQVLHVTANHPLASKDRWIRADALDVERHQLWVSESPSAVAQHGPACRDDVSLESPVLGRLGGGAVPLASVELDKEPMRRDSEIGVEHADRQLRYVGNAGGGEGSRNIPLIPATKAALARRGALQEFLAWARAASRRIVCGRHLQLASGGVHGLVPTGVVVGYPTDYPGRLQYLCDRRARAVEPERQRDRGLPVEVERDDVLLREVVCHGFTLKDIDVTSRKHTGTVYNLEVKGARTFVADGVLVHNCRCSFVALSEEEANEEGVTNDPTEADADDGFGGRPSTDDWEPDPSRFDDPIARELRSKLDE